MPLLTRLSAAIQAQLVTQFTTAVGSGTAATLLADATARKIRTKKSRVRSLLRRVAAKNTIAVSSKEAAVARGVTAIADAATDSITETTASVGKALTYKISNTGTDLLSLGAITLGSLSNCTATLTTEWTSESLAISSTGTASTVVEAVPAEPANINGASNSSFILTVVPTAAGAWSLTISIVNSDANENPYNWTISGTALANTPEMNVAQGVTPLADGGTDAVGSIASGNGMARSYTITNAGGAALAITTPVVIGSKVNCNVVVNTQPAATVAPYDATTTLALTITPTAPGAFSFTVSMANTDASENPYNWTVSGTGT